MHEVQERANQPNCMPRLISRQSQLTQEHSATNFLCHYGTSLQQLKLLRYFQFFPRSALHSVTLTHAFLFISSFFLGYIGELLCSQTCCLHLKAPEHTSASQALCLDLKTPEDTLIHIETKSKKDFPYYLLLNNP